MIHLFHWLTCLTELELITNEKCRIVVFQNRVVQDIVSIIKLALNSRDTDSFMSIYYKVGTFLRKVDASNICEKSIREEKRCLMLRCHVDSAVDA